MHTRAPLFALEMSNLLPDKSLYKNDFGKSMVQTPEDADTFNQVDSELSNTGHR